MQSLQVIDCNQHAENVGKEKSIVDFVHNHWGKAEDWNGCYDHLKMAGGNLGTNLS